MSDDRTRELLIVIEKAARTLMTESGHTFEIPNLSRDAGRHLTILELRSTGIHNGYCDQHGYWIVDPDDGDLYPSWPILVKKIGKVELPK